jgi:GxxExxY protein
MLEQEELTGTILGAAYEVHSLLGPGLLESAYEQCICFELSRRRIPFERQVPLALTFKDQKLDCGYRLDLVVSRHVIVELKSIDALLPVHEAQLLTYLRLGGFPVGLMINFNVRRLKHGIMRRVRSSP